MKFVFALLFLAAAAYAAPSGIIGAPYVVGAPTVIAAAPALVAHPNGAVVPLDEPAVAIAKANHLATKGKILASRYGVLGALW